MTDPQWPSYPVGSHDVIFALGVASHNYTELESSLVFIFATALGIPHELATMIHARVGSEACVHLIEQVLPPKTIMGPPTRDEVEIRYFIKGFQACNLNRAHLAHSSTSPMIPESWGAPLFKTSKAGKVTMAMPELRELRQVADDIHAYHVYGRALGNAINARSVGLSIFAFPWPDRPPPPHKLEYTSEPRPARSSRLGR
jgi:hypothetical protein